MTRLPARGASVRSITLTSVSATALMLFATSLPAMAQTTLAAPAKLTDFLECCRLNNLLLWNQAVQSP